MAIMLSNSYIRVKDTNDNEYIIYPITKVENIEGIENFATKEYVKDTIKELIGTSPSTLDTIQELANAIGNDENFATTIAEKLGEKASINHTHNYSDIVNMPTMTQEEADRMISEIFGENTNEPQ